MHPCGLGCGGARRRPPVRPSPALLAAGLVLLLAAIAFPPLLACRDRRPQGTVVFDFARNLDFASTEHELTSLSFGTPAARSYMGDGWSVDETTAGGRTFTWSEGDQSSVVFFLARVRPLTLKFRCAPLSAEGLAPQALAVQLNGRRLVDVELAPGARSYEVSLPAGALVAGQNDLVFRYRWTHRPSDDGAGSAGRRRLAVAWFGLGFGSGDTAPPGMPKVEGDGETLLLPAGAQAAYHLRVPAGSRLTADSIQFEPRDGAALAVLVQPDGGPERELAQLTRATDGWAAELDAPPGTFLRVAFRAVPVAGRDGTGLVRLTRPALRSVSSGGERALAAPPSAARRPHVFIYLVDTLRADHLGCYGYRKPVSPRVDAFAGEATVFDGIAPSSWTKASVASLLTGRSPIVHRAEDRGDTLVPDTVTLSKLLGAAGYRTYALYANTWVSGTFGLDQGFEERRFLQGRSDRITRELLSWLRRRAKDDRLFAYIHTVDPHAPYEPTPEYRRRFAPNATRTRITPVWLEDVAARARRGEPLPPGFVEEATALYDAEIAFNDAQFGLFVDELKRLGIYDDSLVIFTSDHGEEFFEHGGVSHGHTLYREVLEVPLIVKWPSGLATVPAGRGTRAQLLDVFPTVLDVVGVPAPAGLEGRSLRQAPPTEVRPEGSGILSYLKLDGTNLQAVTEERWKLIRAGALDEARAPTRLYDTSSDAGERSDTGTAHPVLAAHLAAQLAAAAARRPSGPAPPQAETPPEIIERLRALGYVR